MEGYGDSVNLYKESLESAGIAQQKFNLYQQGTEAQLNKLKASWQGVWMASFKSNDLQMFIGGLNEVAKGIKLVVGQFGLMAPALAIASIAVVAFNTKVKTSLIALNTSIRTSVTQFGVLSTSLVRTGDAVAIGSARMGIFRSAMYNMTLASRAAGVAVGFLGNAMKAVGGFLATTALPVAAIMAVGYGIQKLTEHISKQRAEEAQLKSQQEQLITSYSKHKDEVSKLTIEYERLSTIKNSGSGLSTDEDKQYIEVQNKLAKILPTISAGFDSKGNSIIKSSIAIKEQTDLLEKQIKVKKEQQKIDAPQKLADSVSGISDLQDEAKKQSKLADSFKDQVKSLEEGKVKHSQILYVMGQENEASLKGANALNQINAKQQKNAEIIKGYFSKSDIDSSGITQISSVLSQISLKGKDMGEIDLMFKSISKAVENLNVALDSNDSTGINKAVATLLSLGISGKQVNVILGELKNKTKDNAKATDDASKSQKDYAIELQKTIDAEMGKASAEEYIVGTTQGLIDKSKELITTYQLLSNMENLSAEQKKQLADATGQLNALYPQFVENGKLNVEQMRKEAEAQDILLKAVTDVSNGHADAEEMMTLNSAMQAKNRLEIMSAELIALQKLMDTYGKASEYQAKMAEETGDDRAIFQAQKFHNAQQKISDSYTNTKAEIDKLIPSYDSQIRKLANATNYQGQYYNATDKSTDASSKSIYVTDKYKQSLEALNAQIANLENLQKKYSTDSSKYRTALSKEITLLSKKKELMEAQAKALASQIKSGNIKPVGMVNNGSSSSSSYSGSSSASGSSTSATIWNFFRSRGLNDSAIAGIMGNLQQESGLRTTARNPNGATGIAQWMGSRLTGLKNYASQKGTGWDDLGTQLEWLWKEFTPMLNKSGGINSFNQMSPSQAANMFEAKFERSGGSALASRQKYANQFYSQFNGSSIASPSPSSTTSSAADKAQAIDQAKSDLIQLQLDANDVANQLEAIKIAIVQSKIDEAINTATNKINFLDHALDRSKLQQEKHAEGTYYWNNELQVQIKLTTQKISATQQEVTSIKNLIKTEKLSADQRTDLNEKLLELTTTQYEYTKSVSDSYKTIRESQTNFKVDAVQKLYDGEIKKLQDKLDLLDKVEKAEDRITQQKELQNQIDKAKSDKSHEYIDKNGNSVLTYDISAVSDLEKQMSDLTGQWAKDDAKQSLSDQIAEMETKRDDSIAKLQKLNEDYQTKAFNNTIDLQNIMKQFVTDLGKLYSTSIVLPKHHSGGIAGSLTTSAGEFVNKLFNVKPNETISKLLHGEVVINPMLPNVKSNIQSLQNLLANGRQQMGAIDQSRTIILQNPVIKANNPMELFRDIDNISRSY